MHQSKAKMAIREGTQKQSTDEINPEEDEFFCRDLKVKTDFATELLPEESYRV